MQREKCSERCDWPDCTKAECLVYAPTYLVTSPYWLQELPRPFIPETEEDYNEGLYEAAHELAPGSKYVRRGDNGQLWSHGQHLTEGIDFTIENDIAVPVKQEAPQ